MRQLEDGTYMYDTDSQWDRFFVHLFFSLVCVALFAGFVFFAVEEFKDAGWTAFYYLTDKGTAYVVQCLAWSIWLFLNIKEAAKQWRKNTSKAFQND